MSVDIRALPSIKGICRQNVRLKDTTWFRVGGAAEVLFKPSGLEDLACFLQEKDKGIDVYTLGLCSNVIIRDKGIGGVVVKLGKEFTNIEYKNAERDEKIISVGCAVASRDLALFALENELSGVEFLIGIPGSIGGAVAMNSGCYSQEISDCLIEVEAVNKATGKVYTLPAKSLKLSYRRNDLSSEFIFTKASFKLSQGNKDKIKERMNQITQERTLTQPINSRTGGSTFKNPKDHKAWELIDKAGLRGYVHGKTQVSDKHTNWLICQEGATAQELETLGELIREMVSKKFGVNLEWEIRRIGAK